MTRWIATRYSDAYHGPKHATRPGQTQHGRRTL